MAFIAMKGTFHVAGYSPDGDSIRFKAENEKNWDLMNGPRVKLNARKHAQLRFEGIDTLETHYNSFHQPLQFGQLATDFLIEELKITDVVWDKEHGRVIQASDGTEGYILTRSAEKYGRPVSFVFSNDVDFEDGEEIFLDAKLIKKSINYKTVKEGLAYCTFYSGLFYDLRNELAKATVKARTESKGFWAYDRTIAGVEADGIATALQQKYVILPKLFRRIMSYMGNGGEISGFIDYLRADPEPILLLSNNHFTYFHNAVSLQDNIVKMITYPEDIVFIEI